MNHWSVLRLVRMLPGPKPHNPYFDPAKHHHTPVGFRNNHPRAPPTQEELARLHRDLEAKAPASAPRVDLSPVAPDLALLQANRTRHTVTWIGHSTVLVQTGGRNLITDPMFSRRASPLPFTGPRRHQPPGIALRDLPPIDLVLISHNHYDHLDLPSVRALSRQRGAPPLRGAVGAGALVPPPSAPCERRGAGLVGDPRGGGCDGDAGAGTPLERAHPLGRQQHPVGRLGGGARGLPFPSPAIPPTRRIFPTSAAGSGRSTSPPSPSATTSRAGSCATTTSIRRRRCASTARSVRAARSASIGGHLRA
jgi:beta-lactamase family protein